jgi:hypothetical protein
MTIKSTTFFLTVVLVAIITATMISAPQMIMTAYAQTTPPTQKACPPGYTFHPEQGKCLADVKCPTGSSLQGTNCVSQTPACPTGSTLKSDGTCTSGPACPTGSTLQSDGTCTSGPACPTGSTLQSDGKCLSDTPACPSGSTLQTNGKCLSPSTTQCDTTAFGPAGPSPEGPIYGTDNGQCTALGSPSVIKAGICKDTLGGVITDASIGAGQPDKLCTYPPSTIPGVESPNQCTAPFEATGTGQGQCIAPNQCVSPFTATGTGQGQCTAPNLCTAPFQATGTGQGECIAPNQCVSPFTATGTGTQGQCVAPITVVGTCPPAPNGFTIVTVNGKLQCSTKPGQGPGTST